jgi:hypothetical protein
MEGLVIIASMSNNKIAQSGVYEFQIDPGVNSIFNIFFTIIFQVEIDGHFSAKARV